MDLYPTLTELAGLIPPTNLEGKSFRDLLENPALAGKTTPIDEIKGLKLWTDDFSSLYQILK